MNNTYKIGQIRRQQFSINDFKEDLTAICKKVESENKVVQADIAFTDMGIAINNRSYVRTETYYVRVRIKRRTDSSQSFEIKLQEDSGALLEEPRVQHIKNIVVYQKVNPKEEYDYFEFIFSPNSQYNKLVFTMSRTVTDFYTTTGSKHGRVMEFDIEDVRVVKNLLSSSVMTSYYGDVGMFRKIGIQADPGLMFSLNGEEMRIGRSGFYELYDDNIPIVSLGFVIKDLPKKVVLPATGAEMPPKVSIEEWRDEQVDDTTNSDSRDHKYIEKELPHKDEFIVDFKY